MGSSGEVIGQVLKTTLISKICTVKHCLNLEIYTGMLMEILKKYLYNALISIMILLSISCSSYSNNNITKLQEIEFDSSEVFPQGGSFVLFSKNDRCILQGKSYSDYGNYEYKYIFNNKNLINATIIENKYKEPLFVESEPEIEKSNIINLSKDKDIKISFLALLNYIRSENLKKCKFKN